MRVSSRQAQPNPAGHGSSSAGCLRQTRWDWLAIRYFADIRRIVGVARLIGAGDMRAESDRAAAGKHLRPWHAPFTHFPVAA